MEPGEFKQLIEQVACLSRPQRVDLADVLSRGLRQDETAALIDAVVPRACPHCRSSRLYRNGQADGLQRYHCVDCMRSFNALTGTPLARLRHRSKWLSYLECMLQSGTVRRAAALVGIHKNTSFRWRHRFLAGARHDRSVRLEGITEADETYRSSRRRARANSLARRAAAAGRRGCAACPTSMPASWLRVTAAAGPSISSQVGRR